MSIDYDPGASEANQLNRIKLMIAAAKKAHKAKFADGDEPQGLTAADLPQTDVQPTPGRHQTGADRANRSAAYDKAGVPFRMERDTRLFVLVLFGRHRSHPSYPSLPAVNRYSASHGRSVTSIASARWLTSSS